MKLVFLALALFVNEALGVCPSLDDMECQSYLPLNGLTCNLRTTYIEVDGELCEACPLCDPLPEGVQCPTITCNPDIALRMDCGKVDYMMKMRINGVWCDACEVSVYECTWTGGIPFPPSP
ncbi:hypothetical protein ACF0H5_007239 [Mactra antiquata]